MMENGMKLYIINGPNLNMLGIREPAHYGKTDYKSLVEMIRAHAEMHGVETVFYQSNHEGVLSKNLTHLNSLFKIKSKTSFTYSSLKNLTPFSNDDRQ